MRKYLEYIKSYDIYSRKISLRFSDQEEFTTYCGLCSTFLLFFTTISVLCVQLSDVSNGRLLSTNTLRTPLENKDSD
jgi:hypothetical protein